VRALDLEVRRAVADSSGEYVDWLAGLVATPSVNPRYDFPTTGEAAAQQLLAGLLASAGVDVALRPIDRARLERHAGETTLSASYEGRPNLTARLGPPEAVLVLNSHIDVVGIAPDEVWETDPFAPRIRDGTLVGRGAVDAKGSLAAMAAALATVRRMEVPLRRGVVLTSVVDEEGGGGGTLAALDEVAGAAAAVVGEPTGLRVSPATRGHWMVRLVVPGRRAHPGAAHEGVNPIDKAYRFVQAAWQVQAALDRARPHPLWTHQPVQHVFNVATFEAGRWGQSASVPGEARLEVMVGTVGGESLEEIRAVVDEAFRRVIATDAWLREHEPQIEWTPRRNAGAETPREAEVVRIMQRAVEAATGAPARLEGLSAVTDMRHLVHAGGLPCVNVGPGEMRLAHTAGEALPLEEYLLAIEVYTRAILAWGTRNSGEGGEA
jgi:acetylornithine deacetylase